MHLELYLPYIVLYMCFLPGSFKNKRLSATLLIFNLQRFMNKQNKGDSVILIFKAILQYENRNTQRKRSGKSGGADAGWCESFKRSETGNRR